MKLINTIFLSKSCKIMQTYSNFTVGGSLSVNVHGRYIGEGPLIRLVESIEVVLADGKEVIASRTENPEIFFAAIGGFGLGLRCFCRSGRHAFSRPPPQGARGFSQRAPHKPRTFRRANQGPRRRNQFKFPLTSN